MKQPRQRKIEAVVQKFSIDAQPKERAFWMTRTPEERMAALESIRNEYHSDDESQQRLQRVYRVIKRK